MNTSHRWMIPSRAASESCSKAQLDEEHGEDAGWLTWKAAAVGDIFFIPSCTTDFSVVSNPGIFRREKGRNRGSHLPGTPWTGLTDTRPCREAANRRPTTHQGKEYKRKAYTFIIYACPQKRTTHTRAHGATGSSGALGPWLRLPPPNERPASRRRGGELDAFSLSNLRPKGPKCLRDSPPVVGERAGASGFGQGCLLLCGRMRCASKLPLSLYSILQKGEGRDQELDDCPCSSLSSAPRGSSVPLGTRDGPFEGRGRGGRGRGRGRDVGRPTEGGKDVIERQSRDEDTSPVHPLLVVKSCQNRGPMALT